ncbi:MAG: anthranilate synthase component I [Alphaproteobacteria bacterium]
MTPLPSFTDFKKVYEDGSPQLVFTEHVADLETTVSAYMKLCADRPMSFLFDSVEGGAVRGRYSFIGMKPDMIFRARGNKPELNTKARHDLEAFEPMEEDTLTALRRLVRENRIDMPAGLPPMSAGLFGYMAYDGIRLIEDLPDCPPDILGIPDFIFMRPTIMAVFDSVRDMITIVTPVYPAEGISATAAYDRAVERLNDAVADLNRPLSQPAIDFDEPLEKPEIISNTGKDTYLQMVEKAKEYIVAGDIFQVVPSHRFMRRFTLPPFELFRALRRTNPSPYMYFLNFGTFQVAGSSPEILVQTRDGKVVVRPIAGTRRRGYDDAEDKALEEELLSDPKELSEHLMLLDLGRNDVGRVAEIGSVTVTDQFFIERYSHVMHIVSNVEGDLSDDFDSIAALMAGAPAGTVSGAPKVRAMEIIDELEKEKRCLYAGGVGYFAADGSMDTCIALRTGVIKDGMLHVQAGGGVVADSKPEAEYQETVDKSKAVFRAAEEAERLAQRGQSRY